MPGALGGPHEPTTVPRAGVIRALEADDLPSVVATSAAAFGLDIGDPSVAQRWRERVAHPWATDPGGCFVAERDGRVVGAVQAIRRERLWCLSLLTIDPGVQSLGMGRALLARALGYGPDTDAGLIPSSSDPRALRLYALAGFALHPTFDAVGVIDRRTVLRSGGEVRDGGSADLEALSCISRDVRGAPHTPELEFALRAGARILRLADRGFAVAMPGRGVWLLVARDEAAASSLLWSALAVVGETEHPAVRWMTAGQQWAIEVVLRAGLQLSAFGALCTRGRVGALRAFLPSGPFA
jgi:GNAT superfamily N-acetyltransferase